MHFALRVRQGFVGTFMVLWAVYPLPTSARSVASSDVEIMKETFTQAWQRATETTKKRSEIEQYLVHVDSSVTNAKRDIDRASAERSAIDVLMEERQQMLETIAGQILHVANARATYDALLQGREVTVHRAIVARLDERDKVIDIPPVYVGSLQFDGDAEVQDVLRILRSTRVDQLHALRRDTVLADARLRTVELSLQKDIQRLRARQKLLASTVVEKTSFIDASWKQKKLSEQELKQVAAEAAESNARAAALQSSLRNINEQLKKKKHQELSLAIEKFKRDDDALLSKKHVLESQDQLLLEKEQMIHRLFAETIAQRNTDKRQYRRTQDRELERETILVRLGKISETADGSSVADLLPGEKQELEAKAAFLAEHIALMHTGVPDAIAEEYLRVKADSVRVAERRVEIAASIDAVVRERAELLRKISDVVAERDGIEQKFSLDGLPPIFVWPVHGTLTAGYHDPEYKAVFGVPHKAVDIAVPFATTVRAVSDGVVFAVRDGGAKGYSYLLIGHRNGYSSLYGHVSSFLVHQGDIVSMGQAIALSGGTPGTHGAGHMTTGAHVHLEIMKDGVHVNPLSVLR